MIYMYKNNNFIRKTAYLFLFFIIISLSIAHGNVYSENQILVGMSAAFKGATGGLGDGRHRELRRGYVRGSYQSNEHNDHHNSSSRDRCVRSRCFCVEKQIETHTPLFPTLSHTE